MSKIRIATRNSPLALWQANYVKDILRQKHESLEVEIVGMTTRGDQMLDRSLSKVGGKGLFLKELEVSLLNRQTDIAVHSMKDVPVLLPEGLEIPVLCARHDPRDAFVSNKYQNLYALPKGSKVGTSSLRRASQLKSAFPNLEFIELRGNVNTRLAKLDSDEYDAIILAAAGLIRLGFDHRIKQFIAAELCLPAVGQGIVGIECRSDDEYVKRLLEPLNDPESEIVLAAERQMNAALNGGCQVPIAGFAELGKGRIKMRGIVASVDGSKVLRSEYSSTDISPASAQQLGDRVAADLLAQGAKSILDSLEHVDEPTAVQDSPVVILTRGKRYLGNMESILRRLEYNPVTFTTVDIEANKDASLEAKLGDLSVYTDLLFVSRNAVEYGMKFIQSERAIPDNVRVMAVGGETAKQLYGHGIDALFPDQGTGADALLAVKQLADLSDRHILIFRGTNGLTWPADEMRKRGATVSHADVYRQQVPENGKANLKSLLKSHAKVDGVFLHSANSAANFMNFARYDLAKFKETKLVVGSERIGEVVRKLGWRNEISVALSPANKHMMIAFSGNHVAKLP